MKITRPSRIATARMLALATVLSTTSGCSWVHDRVALDPSGARRFPSRIRRKPDAPPVVKLGVEPVPEAAKSAPTIEPTLPALEGAVP